VRCEHTRGLLLRSVRKLEHIADGESVLCRMLLQKSHPGGRVQLWHAVCPIPQSRRQEPQSSHSADDGLGRTHFMEAHSGCRSASIYALVLFAAFLTRRATTPHTVLWLDTSNGPVVLEVPPDVLGPMDDAWFRWVTDVGFTGPDKGKGGKYLLLPPGYKGEVPEGYFVARSRTFGNLLFFRTFLKDGDPKPGVESVKKDLRAYPLAKADNPPPMKFVDISARRSTRSARPTSRPSNTSIASSRMNHAMRWTPTRWACSPQSVSRKGSRSHPTRA
jgi:hypothetical protein